MSRSLNNINSVFWTEDPFVLIKDNNYLNFIPKYESTREEQLNSIVRFCLYFIIITIILQNDEKWLYLPIIMIVIASIFFYIDKYDKNHNIKRFKKVINDRKKTMIKKLKKKQLGNFKSNDFINNDIDVNDDIEDTEGIESIEDINDIESIEDINDIEDAKGIDEDTMNINDINMEENNEVEAGFYDSSGNMLIGKKYTQPEYKSNNTIQNNYTSDEILEYQQNTCKRPTRDNPFMNPNVTDYNNGDSPTACNADDEDIQKEIGLNFNKDLYRNVEDLWDKKNSQRQFYTLPSTSIPNNQVDFAKWLYLQPKTCKESQDNCLKYEDIRFKR